MIPGLRPDGLIRLLGRLGVVAGAALFVVALLAVGSAAQDGTTTTGPPESSTTSSSTTSTTTTLPEPVDGVGLVDPTEGVWFLRDAVSGETTSFYFGNPGDVPFMGDWDCDGVDTPGLYRQAFPSLVSCLVSPRPSDCVTYSSYSSVASEK